MKINNKGISLVELLAVSLITSIVLLTLSQVIILLSNIEVNNRELNIISNEGAMIINDINYRYDGILPLTYEPCLNNDDCLTMIMTESDKFQIGFINDPDKGEVIQIIRTTDGVQSVEILEQTANMKNTSIYQVCLECNEGEVFIMEFDLYFDEKYTKTFRTSFRIY